MGLDKLEASSQKQGAARYWLLPGIAMFVAIVLLLGGEAARDGFRFDRAGIAAGELWRLVSGHFVHLGWPHFALNSAGLLLVWYLVGDVFDARRWIVISALSIVTMDLGLWYLDPELAWYVGLSGLLHGILAAGLVEKLRKPSVEAVALAVLLLGKLAWEQLSGPLPGSEMSAGGTVIVDSHLFGALGGAVAALLLRIRVRKPAPI